MKYSLFYHLFPMQKDFAKHINKYSNRTANSRWYYTEITEHPGRNHRANRNWKMHDGRRADPL